MKQIFLLIALFCSLTAGAQTQPTQGTTYYLPKTGLRFSLLIEKTTYKPGDLAVYSEKYFKKRVATEPSTTYRIVGQSLSTYGLPDTTKQYTLTFDRKRSVLNAALDENNVLKAVNDKPRTYEKPAPFVAAPKRKAPSAQEYLTEDILSAGSRAKMAQLLAQEIYDIRDSRNLLTRGEAEFMPKDGAQLQIMLQQLTNQEQALSSMFTGTTEVDTVEQEVLFVPEKEVQKQLLFRFSKKLGMVDNDDLAGTPYYISVTDEHIIQPLKEAIPQEKKSKEDIGLNVNIPGQIRVQLIHDGRTEGNYHVLAAQFGRLEALSAELFGKKMLTMIVLNPINGSVESIKTQPID